MVEQTLKEIYYWREASFFSIRLTLNSSEIYLNRLIVNKIIYEFYHALIENLREQR